MNSSEIINSGFASVGISGWMWGIDLTTSNSPALPTFWGHMDLFTYSYAFAGGENWSILHCMSQYLLRIPEKMVYRV